MLRSISSPHSCTLAVAVLADWTTNSCTRSGVDLATSSSLAPRIEPFIIRSTVSSNLALPFMTISLTSSNADLTFLPPGLAAASSSLPPAASFADRSLSLIDVRAEDSISPVFGATPCTRSAAVPTPENTVPAAAPPMAPSLISFQSRSFSWLAAYCLMAVPVPSVRPSSGMSSALRPSVCLNVSLPRFARPLPMICRPTRPGTSDSTAEAPAPPRKASPRRVPALCCRACGSACCF